MHPNQIQSWKRQAVDRLEETFIRGRPVPSGEREEEIKTLHAKIGQLSIEKDFLSKVRGAMYLTAVIDWYSRKALAHRVSKHDGRKSRWLDNVYLECFCPSVKAGKINLRTQ